MRWLIIGVMCGVAGLLLQGCQNAAEQQAEAEIQRAEAVMHRVEMYYRHRDSAAILPIINELRATHILTDPPRMNFFCGFFSRVFAQNPDRLEHWFTRIIRYPVDEQMIFITALRWANTSATRAVFEYYQENVDTPAITLFCRSVEDIAPPNLMARPLRAAGNIDGARGAFCGGAEEPYLLALVSTAVAIDREGLPDRLAERAKLNLIQWSKRDNVIRRLIKDFSEGANERQKQVIETILNPPDAMNFSLESAARHK